MARSDAAWSRCETLAPTTAVRHLAARASAREIGGHGRPATKPARVSANGPARVLIGLRARTILRVAAVALLVSGCDPALGCAGERAKRPPPTRSTFAGEPPTGPLGVADEGVTYAGCLRVLRGPACELEIGGRLRLWSRVHWGSLEVRLSGEPLAIESRVVAGGYQASLEINELPAVLEVLAGRRRQVLRLETYRRFPALDAALAAKNAGSFAEALRLSTVDPSSAARPEALLLDGVGARVELRRGNWQAASARLERSAVGLLAQGFVSDALRDALARFFLLLHRQFRLGEARRWLERWRATAQSYPIGRGLLHEHQALLLSSSGQVPSALHHLSDAERLYARLGQSEDVLDAQVERIRLLGELGQVRQAHAAHQRLMPPDEQAPACDRAQRYVLHSWLSMQLVEDGERGITKATAALLERAREEARRCGDVQLTHTERLNRGLWALRSGDAAPMAAVERERRAAPEPEGAYLAAWASELSGRLALRQQRWGAAERHFVRQRSLGAISGDLDAALRARLGLADVAEARAQSAQALGYLLEAVELLHEAQRRAPLGPLAQSQHASRQRAARRLVGALLDQGRAKPAFRVALAAYRAVLAAQARQVGQGSAALEATLGEYRRRRRALDEGMESDWQLTQPELQARLGQRKVELEALSQLLATAVGALPESPTEPPSQPPVGEAWLLPFPLERGWAVFGAMRERLEVVRVDSLRTPPPRGAWHPEWADALEPVLRGSKVVVALPAGASRTWPLERLVIADRPLLGRGLAFGSGLGPLRSAAKTGRREPALIFDTRGDLPGARREARLVRRVLALSPERILSGEAATTTRVFQLLESTDHLHVAGHARGADGAAGPALLLAGQSELRAWELFGLQSVPRQVVLSACRAADTAPLSTGLGWGLAQAFLVNGSESVIAPTESIEDGVAWELQRTLHASLTRELDVREAFFAMQRWAAGRPELPNPFRLYVR